ncbi:low affinity immunoglobulin gamma Fc region receptor II-b-like [Phascolarctos cinereus]|uniref:low affinity immunoglobulin gamma Fc region receptor II-like n=1 Tax=Phascolarctos cinereus TaxID=38626 RepID=UPI000A287239|nr:low affinity immunoglobulin gamma Fc region receptor II-like [Phascolarctos cinereus]
MAGPWVPQPVTTTSSVLLWIALLCLAPAIRSNGPPRAVLTLEPPWFNVLRGDNVTLNCEGFQTPGHDSSEWLHNGSTVHIHQDSYTIPAVNIEDSGEYQCRTEQTALSNSVKLQVSSDWLLLQVERLEFMEGDSMILRCHSWRSKPLHKVTYYHNDQALKYEYKNFDYIVPQVNYTHSGSYYCTGFMGHISHLSATVVITVQGGKLSSVNVVIITLVLAVVIATIAAAALYYYKRHKKPAHTPDEIGRIEVENSMSYSLLKHTDSPEEEASGHSVYQNR